jgi:hypothetical protein
MSLKFFMLCAAAALIARALEILLRKFGVRSRLHFYGLYALVIPVVSGLAYSNIPSLLVITTNSLGILLLVLSFWRASRESSTT